MAFVLNDRVKEPATTTGTGTFSLSGTAVTGFVTFLAAIGSGNSTYYLAYDAVANVWESGYGVITSGSPVTLTRAGILNNSSGGTSAINFANPPTIWCDLPAAGIVFQDSSGNITVVSSASFYFGRQGATTPAFAVASSGTASTGVGVQGLSAGSGAKIITTSSSSNEGLFIDAKGTGKITLGATSTGDIVLGSTLQCPDNSTWDTGGITLTHVSAAIVDSTFSGTTAGVLQMETGSSIASLVCAANSASTRDHVYFVNTNGNVGSITTSASATVYLTTSDYRLKSDMQPLSAGVIAKLKPVTFTWDSGDVGVGFIAHELQEHVPEAVSGVKDEMRDVGDVHDADGNLIAQAVGEDAAHVDHTWTKTHSVPKYQGVDMAKVVPHLVAEIQLLMQRVADLELKLAAK